MTLVLCSRKGLFLGLGCLGAKYHLVQEIVAGKKKKKRTPPRGRYIVATLNNLSSDSQKVKKALRSLLATIHSYVPENITQHTHCPFDDHKTAMDIRTFCRNVTQAYTNQDKKSICKLILLDDGNPQLQQLQETLYSVRYVCLAQGRLSPRKGSYGKSGRLDSQPSHLPQTIATTDRCQQRLSDQPHKLRWSRRRASCGTLSPTTSSSLSRPH